MKSILFVAAVGAIAPAYALDVDLVPYGYVSQVMRESKAATQATTAPASHARSKVAAETLEAARLGLLHIGEAGPTQATPAQEALIRSADQPAVGIEAASR